MVYLVRRVFRYVKRTVKHEGQPHGRSLILLCTRHDESRLRAARAVRIDETF